MTKTEIETGIQAINDHKKIKNLEKRLELAKLILREAGIRWNVTHETPGEAVELKTPSGIILIAFPKAKLQIKASPELLRSLIECDGCVNAMLQLKHGQYAVDFEWFEKHVMHRLVPINEYGECDDECAVQFQCLACDHWKVCRRPEKHEGTHAVERDAEAAYPGPR